MKHFGRSRQPWNWMSTLHRLTRLSAGSTCTAANGTMPFESFKTRESSPELQTWTFSWTWALPTPCRDARIRQEEYSRTSSNYTSKASFPLLHWRSYMERWANRTKLLSGWKRPIRREILNSHISKRDEDSSHC